MPSMRSSKTEILRVGPEAGDQATAKALDELRVKGQINSKDHSQAKGQESQWLR